MKRAVQRIWNDKASTFTPIIGNIIMALIVGSVFYGTPNASAGFFSKGSVLFFAVLLNALSAISEINSLYAQRPIVEKHKSYAFYHPATEVKFNTFQHALINLTNIRFRQLLASLSTYR
jgi:ATP-binding cassette subfamily G (WHITE) protein 2 (PDR)